MECRDDAEVDVETLRGSAGGPGGLQWSVTRTGHEVTVALVGEVDLGSASALAEALNPVIGANPFSVIIDLEQLSFLDSSGIRCLVNAAKDASAVGSHLVVQRPTPMILRALQICGVDELLLHGGSSENAPPGD
jgi:anti-sigma B factor antagonist